MRKFAVWIGTLLGVLAAGAACDVARSEDLLTLARQVSVSGTAITRVAPDAVVWNIHVRRANKDLATAQAECDATVKRILGMREELKVKPEDMQTSNLSIQKVFDRDQAGNQTSFRHFSVDRTVTIRQRDVSRFDEILARLVATSDVEASYSLESSAYFELRAKTRLDAVRIAKSKGAAMAEALDAKLGRVMRISEPRDRDWNYAVQGINNAMTVAGRDAEPDGQTGTFAAGQIEIRVSVDVVFELQ